MDADYLDWALADFSGYSAVDELYDGPFCVRGVVRLTDALRLAGKAPPLVSRPNNWLRIVYLTRNNEAIRNLRSFIPGRRMPNLLSGRKSRRVRNAPQVPFLE